MRHVQRVLIEREFDFIVSAVGGHLVRDIVGKSPPFDNADYIFHDHRLVAKLKCLEENKADDVGTQKKFRRLWIAWRQRELVSGPIPRRYNTRDLPEICQTEFLAVMAKPIRRRVQKANKQVRETKIALGLSDYKGILFIVNDGNFMFPPAATIHAVQLALQRDFREIRHFVFFTANMYAAVKGVKQPVLCWISFDMDNNKTGPAETLYDELRARWVRRHAEITGIPAVESELTDDQMEGFWFANYIA